MTTMMLTTASMANLASSRSNMYRLLATLFAKPADAQLLRLLHSWTLAEKELDRAIPSPRMSQGAGKLGAWFERTSAQHVDALTASLSSEFTRLFRGLSRFDSPLPPYESVYIDSGVLYGASTGRVIEKFRQFGLGVQDNEPPDHLPLELDFVAFLCEQEQLCWDTGKESKEWLKEQSSFIDEHLLKWIPAFCEKVREFDSTGFYRALADIAEGWINYDREVVDNLLGVNVAVDVAS